MPTTLHTAPSPRARPSVLPIPTGGTAPVLDVVVPVHNEENGLEPSIRRLHEHLTERFPYRFRIIVADNASTDRTPEISKALEAEIPEVVAVSLEEKGRGRALRAVWTASDAPVLVYMDVDLSTDLAALPPLVAPLISGHSDMAIGSRLAKGARVVRGPKREIISRCYNLLLRGTLAARFSDAQCGFKAIRADVAERLLPHVQDTGWFFDTELLVLAERSGARIHEVPVDWVDDPDSRVDIVSTAAADILGILRLGRALTTGTVPIAHLRAQLGRNPIPVDAPGVPRGLARQLARFAVIGVVSTLAYLGLFMLLRTGMNAQAANLLALLVTAIANTAANRRLTFGVRGRSNAGRHQFEGLVVFALGLALTSGSLGVLHAVATPGQDIELAVLVLANLVATMSRFLLLRGWVFAPHRRSES
ncbi:glycosyltransferase [Actinomadura rugatobispora]|uniref:dolichyl-phosphate beta-glucosyltransferase n=1 Tax=Actinomadura rugatobispora TaxID=1994 RepID=A0ABW1ABG3_9ACTN|nr:bifunctional glycosyltransferase family 2/GtrA family protein [Actinomadura rugatobispora]